MLTLNGYKTIQPEMYLLDTNIISELRKQDKANPGVQEFFYQAIDQNIQLYLSAITIGELRRGVDLIRYRGDKEQADLLESWLMEVPIELGYAELSLWRRSRPSSLIIASRL